MVPSRLFKIIGIVTIINIAASFLGFAREITIGYLYGTSYKADAIITAFTIPNFLYVVIGGAITTAFISIYSKLTMREQDTFVQTLLTFLATSIGIITFLFIIFPTFWIGLFFSGMSDEALELTAKLFVFTAPATFFLVISMVLSGLHNVHGNYRLSTFSTFAFNTVYFVIGFGLTPWMMEFSYALGATLGSVAMVTILAYQVKKLQLMPLKLHFAKIPESKRLFQVAMPLIIGGATIQFYVIIQRIYASSLSDGAISAINYASKMTQFPQGVLMASVTTVVYPLLAKAAGEGDHKKIKNAYEQGFRLLTLILLPASIYMWMYAKEIITLVFEYGSFHEDSTNRTYPLLQIFSLSTFSLAMNMYITRFYYALEKTLLPNILNILSVFGINIAVILLFLGTHGAAAIALGTAIGTIVNMLLLIFFARSRLNLAIRWPFVLRACIFIVIFAIILAFFAKLTAGYVLLALIAGGMLSVASVLGALKWIK